MLNGGPLIGLPSGEGGVILGVRAGCSGAGETGLGVASLVLNPGVPGVVGKPGIIGGVLPSVGATGGLGFFVLRLNIPENH